MLIVDGLNGFALFFPRLIVAPPVVVEKSIDKVPLDLILFVVTELLIIFPVEDTEKLLFDIPPVKL